MIGMFVTRLLFILLISACAKRPDYKAGLEHFDKRYKLELGADEYSAFTSQIDDIEPLQRDRLSFYLDLDQDGIKDYFDDDIDGDGFHNYIDEHPLNNAHGGEDLDNNLVPDFIQLSHLISIQEKLALKNIYLIDFGKKSDLKKLNEIIFDKNLLNILTGLNVIYFNTLNLSKRGDYNKEWRTINIYPSANNLYLDTLVHESFHHYAQTYPLIYNQFLEIFGYQSIKNEYGESESFTDADFFISDYAQTNADENFAETFMYLWSLKVDYKTNRFNKTSEFINSDYFTELSRLKFVF
jgi:hypothetical protein